MSGEVDWLFRRRQSYRERPEEKSNACLKMGGVGVGEAHASIRIEAVRQESLLLRAVVDIPPEMMK